MTSGPDGGGLGRRRLVLLALAGLATVGCAPAERAPVRVADAPPTGRPATPASSSSGATASPSASSTTAPGSPSPSRTVPVVRAEPRRVEIPAIGVDEQLIGLGLAADGTLEVPEDPDRVGWFTGGGRPGGPGPTVLAGHVDSRTGPAVFARLTELRTDDELAVTAADGVRRVYRVTRAVDVPKDRFPTEQVFGATPGDELRLITCTGVWDRTLRSHRDNRVVHAVAIR